MPTPSEILEELKKKPFNAAAVSKPAEEKQASVVLTKSEPEVKKEFVSVQKESDGLMMTVDDLVSYLEQNKKMLLLYALKNDVSINYFENGHIGLTVSEKANVDFVSDLQKVLRQATGNVWQIDVKYGTLGETIADKEKQLLEKDEKQISEYPLVRVILEEFKGAKFDTVLRVQKGESSEKDEEEVINNFEEEEE